MKTLVLGRGLYKGKIVKRYYYGGKPSTFKFVRRANTEEIEIAQKNFKTEDTNFAIFRCKQNGQLVGKKYRSADRDNSKSKR